MTMIQVFPATNFIISVRKMVYLLLFITFLPLGNTLYCASKCASNTYVDCSVTGPTFCTLCDSNYYLGGVCLAGSAAGTTIIQQASALTTPSLTSLWSTNSVNTNLTCIKEYDYYANFTFFFDRTLVGDNYLYRLIPITTNHYQVKIKFSLAFVGVWAINNDFIWLHLADAYQSQDLNLTYTCDSSNNGTETLCNTTLPNNISNSFNGVDCLQNFQFVLNHNSSYLTINFTSLNINRDATTQFWNLFDIVVSTVDCNIACRTCYSNTATSCFSCADFYYYVDNNTCQASCLAPTPYILPSPVYPNTGTCVAACPQGFYLSGSTCFACPSSCLTCTNSTTCTLTSSVSSKSLWNEYLTLWVIIIIIGVLLLIGLVYRLLCYSPPVGIQSRPIVFEERVSINETMEPQEQNIHIEEIDYKDNVMVDDNPRRRKRLERDLNRTRGTSFG